MPTNQIQIEWSGFEAKVYDNNGVEHDFTSIFQQIKANGTLGTTLDFTPSRKELKFSVNQKVIDQILEALG